MPVEVEGSLRSVWDDVDGSGTWTSREDGGGGALTSRGGTADGFMPWEAAGSATVLLLLLLGLTDGGE